MNEVVVIGNAGVDTNVFLYGADIDFSVEANFSDNRDTVGQAGGYSSRGYAALGHDVAFIGHVGDDANGRSVRATLAADGIDTRALFTDPAGTARSVNLMYRDGRRKNFYDGKGHMTLLPDAALCRDVLRGARLAHVHLANWARHLLPVARELGLVIACDLQDVVDPADPYRQDFIDAADILFFSAANHDDPKPLIDRFAAGQPERIIVVGMGARGCALGAGGAVRFFPPVALDAPVVDSNGAGDSLAVGFLSSHVLGGYGLEDAIRRGQIAARHACTLRGTSDGLMGQGRLDELFQSLDKYPVNLARPGLKPRGYSTTAPERAFRARPAPRS
jgi:sugar/nucleoside kinase (ribokinase family)